MRTPEALLSEKLQKFFNRGKDRIDKGIEAGK